MEELENFRKDLKQLLEKHWAELSIEDGTIVVWLNSTADSNEVCKSATLNEDIAITSKDF